MKTIKVQNLNATSLSLNGQEINPIDGIFEVPEEDLLKLKLLGFEEIKEVQPSKKKAKKEE